MQEQHTVRATLMVGCDKCSEQATAEIPQNGANLSYNKDGRLDLKQSIHLLPQRWGVIGMEILCTKCLRKKAIKNIGEEWLREQREKRDQDWTKQQDDETIAAQLVEFGEGYLNLTDDELTGMIMSLGYKDNFAIVSVIDRIREKRKEFEDKQAAIKAKEEERDKDKVPF